MKNKLILLTSLVALLFYYSCQAGPQGVGSDPQSGDSFLPKNQDDGYGTTVVTPRPGNLILQLSDKSFDEKLLLNLFDNFEDGASNQTINDDATIDYHITDRCYRHPISPKTGLCVITPSIYKIYMNAIRLIQCIDTENNIVNCSEDGATVSDTYLLYQGPPIESTFTKDGFEFPIKMPPLTRDFEPSGLQFAITKFMQKFPDSGPEAEFIADEMKGVWISRCLTYGLNDNKLDMLELCGQGPAEFGDFTIDIDKDGKFGYLALKKDSDGVSIYESSEITEITTHEKYRQYSDKVYGVKNVSFIDSLFEGKFLAPIFGIKESKTLIKDEPYTLIAMLSHKNTIAFLNGFAMAQNSLSEICVNEFYDDNCEIDYDPIDPFSYNPLRDWFVFNILPTGWLRIEQEIP